MRSPWEELAQAYESLPPNGASAHARLLEVADVWERGAGDIARAFETLERALEVDPDAAEVQAALERLGEAHSAWDRVCEIYARLADSSGSTERNVRLRLNIARIREATGSASAAEEQYQAVLAIDPSHPHPLAQLEKLYRGAERWTELASLLERRTAGLLERLPPGDDRSTRLHELAWIYEEHLAKPYEAIEILGRLAHDEPNDPDIFRAQARLYGKVGLWAKVAVALTRTAELSDRMAAKEARRQVAELFVEKLELPDRAIDAYRTLLELDPSDDGALGALERLYESLARWKELEAVLRRRVARAQGEERVALLRRRAALLEEKIGDPDGAASALKELRLTVGDEPGLHERLLSNLAKAGRARDAQALLGERLTAREAAGAPPDELAQILVDIGILRTRDLQDEAGARKSFERALALLPGHPAASAELARLHLGGADYAAYAAAREREAAAQSDPVRAAGALIEAASVYLEHMRDLEKAKACFGRAFNLDAESRAALSGLLKVSEEEQRWDVAYALGRKRLELATEPMEKAQVLLVLARAAREQPPIAAEARSLLEEAVALAPDLVAAAEALGDLDLAERRYGDAQELLERALAAAKDDHETMARLRHKLGECYDRLGKHDEGYRVLLDADRELPGQLLIRVAMGENRFRARKWREAALHLGSLAEHKDAARHAEMVALALCHAAQAETRLRRPERAPGLYESALRVYAEFAPALGALGELARARGDRAAHARFREREGAALGDPAMLEEAGDEWIELGDALAARRAFERARDAHPPGQPAAIALLEKLLGCQRDQGDLEAALATALALADAETGADARGARRRVAAAIAHARGDLATAAREWTRALGEDPTDEVALLALGEVGNPNEVVALYTRVIHHLPESADAEARARRAALWERLGLLRRDVTHDPRGAVEALEHAVALDPGRPAAREALVTLYEGAEDARDKAILNHRALLSLDILREPSMRALARLYAETGQGEKARGVYQVLELAFGLGAEEQAWLAAHPPPAFGPDDAYPGSFDDALRERTAHPEARLLADVFATLYEGAPTLYGRTFESFGCTPQDRVSPVSPLLAARIFGQLARALGNKKTGLYLKADRGLDGIAIISQPPTGVLIGPRIAEGTPEAELRFQLGRALELARPEYILAATADPKEFAQLFAAVLRAYHPRHARRRTQTGDVSELAQKIKRLLPYTISKRLAELFQRSPQVKWASPLWRAAVRLTAHRVALVLGGDLRAAVRVLVRENEPDLSENPPPRELAELVRRSQPLRDLLTFALSEDHLGARATLTGASPNN
jgi:lipopolysaccharide biosynthesis regulator YciM